MSEFKRFTPCLWFDHQAEEAAAFYVSIFPNSKIGKVTRYGEAGYEVHQRPAGSAMTVEFELDGLGFTGLNGGPVFQFNEAISFVINCATQAEVDHYWEKLSEGGDEKTQQCGWLKDKYGVSWQVVPMALADMLSDSRSDRVGRMTEVMLQMKKLDIAKLRQAFEG